MRFFSWLLPAIISVWICLASTNRCSAQHMNAPDGPCQSAGSGAETTQCFFKASQKSDADLNQVYGQVRKILEPADFHKLQAAQRLWLQFRDANCAAEKNLYSGGSAAPMVSLACVEADTRQRAAELKTMYGWLIDKSAAK